MNKILLLILISFITSDESKNLIIIGDKRIHEMANVLFGLEDSQFYSSYYYSYYYAIITPDPVAYNGYNLKFAATVQTNKLISTDYPIYSQTLSLLKNAEDGTNVLFHIGIDGNSLGPFNDISVYIGRLADKFPNLKFHFVSLVGVDENLAQITNASIKDLNRKLENRIEIVEFENMDYKSVLNEENPREIVVGGKVVDLSNYASEGTGFFKSGYTKLLNAFLEGF